MITVLSFLQGSTDDEEIVRVCFRPNTRRRPILEPAIRLLASQRFVHSRSKRHGSTVLRFVQPVRVDKSVDG